MMNPIFQQIKIVYRWIMDMEENQNLLDSQMRPKWNLVVYPKCGKYPIRLKCVLATQPSIDSVQL